MLTDTGEQSHVSTVETEEGEGTNCRWEDPEVPWVWQD